MSAFDDMLNRYLHMHRNQWVVESLCRFAVVRGDHVQAAEDSEMLHRQTTD